MYMMGKHVQCENGSECIIEWWMELERGSFVITVV